MLGVNEEPLLAAFLQDELFGLGQNTFGPVCHKFFKYLDVEEVVPFHHKHIVGIALTRFFHQLNIMRNTAYIAFVQEHLLNESKSLVAIHVRVATY